MLNDAPIAVDDAAELADLDSPQFIPVLENDFDPDGKSLRVTAVSRPSFGIVSFTGDAVTYRPFRRKAGLDSFTYTVSDFSGATTTAAVSVRTIGIPSAGRYFGTIGNVDGSHETTGFLNVTRTRSGAFTGRVLWQGGQFRLAGNLSDINSTFTLRKNRSSSISVGFV